MARILLINGPNLNLLGTREPEKYGSTTLKQIVTRAASIADGAGVEFDALQSNSEQELIERIHAASHGEPAQHADFILINPAAFTHTSVAIRDALAAVAIPFIEIHLSNIHRREAFRQHSYFSDLAVGVIAGLGAKGYELATLAALEQLGIATDRR